jgi:hypothetical protein
MKVNRKYKKKYKKKAKEIWYETTQEKKERKDRYPLVLSRYSKKINENLTWIIVLLLFIIGLMILWFKLQF